MVSVYILSMIYCRHKSVLWAVFVPMRVLVWCLFVELGSNNMNCHWIEIRVGSSIVCPSCKYIHYISQFWDDAGTSNFCSSSKRTFANMFHSIELYICVVNLIYCMQYVWWSSEILQLHFCFIYRKPWGKIPLLRIEGDTDVDFLYAYENYSLIARHVFKFMAQQCLVQQLNMLNI